MLLPIADSSTSATQNKYKCEYVFFFQGFNPPRQVRSRPVEVNENSCVSNQPDRSSNQAAATSVKGLSLYSVVGGNNSVNITKLLSSKYLSEEGNVNDCDMSMQRDSFHGHGSTRTESQSAVNPAQRRTYAERLGFDSSKISEQINSFNNQMHGISQSSASNDANTTDKTPTLERVLRNVSNTTDRLSLWSVVGSKTSHAHGIPTIPIPSRNLTLTSGVLDHFSAENKNNSARYLSSSTSITTDNTVSKGKRSTSQILALINSVRKLSSPEKSKDVSTNVNDFVSDQQQMQKRDLNDGTPTKTVQEYELENYCLSKQEYPLKHDESESLAISCAEGIDKPLIDAEDIHNPVNAVSDEAKRNDRSVNENNNNNGNSPCFELSFSPLSNVSLTDDEDPTKVTQTQSASQSSSDNHSRITNQKLHTSVEDSDAMLSNGQPATAVYRQQLEGDSNSFLIPSTGVDEKSEVQKVYNNDVMSVPCEANASKASTSFSPMETSLEPIVNHPEPPVNIREEQKTGEKEANCSQDLGGNVLNEVGQQGLNELNASSQLTEGSDKISDSQLLACVTMEESNFKEATCTTRSNDNETNSVSTDQKNKSGYIGVSRDHGARNDLKCSPEERNIQFTASNWFSR